MDKQISQKICVVIPAYNEAKHIKDVVNSALKFVTTVVVVDDGSCDSTSDEAKSAGAIVIKHEHNKGKGVALGTGLRYALDNGFDMAITMDADGQHLSEEIPIFLEAYQRTCAHVILGNRMNNPAAMPLIRRLTNRFMSKLLSRMMKQKIPDTQCGFRLFLKETIPVVLQVEASRFSAESEVLLRLSHNGFSLVSVPISVIYRDEKSKIRPIADTIRFFKMLSRMKQQQRILQRQAKEKKKE